MFRHSYAIFKAANINSSQFEFSNYVHGKHKTCFDCIYYYILRATYKKKRSFKAETNSKDNKITYKELTRKERHRFTCSSGSARLFFVKPRGDGV